MLGHSMVLSLILILGLITYIILQRSVAPITRTPIWLLWGVMMTPALIWSAWVLIQGENKPMPTLLVVVPFIVCPLVYWWLIQVGRIGPADPPARPAQSNVDGEKQDSGGDADSNPPLRPITKAEETQLRDCFPWTVYYLQNLEYRPQAVICWGHLRTNPEEAYKVVQQNIKSLFGDRFLLIFRETLNGKPFFALVPNPYQASGKKEQGEIFRPGLALGLAVVSLFTTTAVGAEMAGVSEKMLQTNPGVLLQGLPYAVALMSILGVHAVARYFVALGYKLQTTLPYFVPIPFFLGTLGAFIQLRSPVPNRKVLFDISIVGPIAGLIVTIPVLMWGLAHSTLVAVRPEVGLLSFDALNPNFSLLLALLSKLSLGSALTPDKAIDLHPVAIAGYIGLAVTAFNLMPVGQLDGGHMVHGMFGHRTSILIGQVARFLMLILGFVQRELLLWALLLLLIPIRDDPALNDITELDNRRDFVGLIALALLVIMILPAPEIVINWLNS